KPERRLDVDHTAELHRIVLYTAPEQSEPRRYGKRPRRRLEERPQRIVRRREQRRLEPECMCEALGDFRERRPLTQHLCAHEVQPEIAVTEPEPRLAAELCDRRERTPRLVGPPPA